MGKNLPNAFKKLKTLLPHYSKKLSENVVFYTNLLDPILQDTTSKSNALTEKIMITFTRFILFILSMILKNNLLLTTENITIFPCVLLIGILPLITLIHFYFTVNFFKPIFVMHH